MKTLVTTTNAQLYNLYILLLRIGIEDGDNAGTCRS